MRKTNSRMGQRLKTGLVVLLTWVAWMTPASSQGSNARSPLCQAIDTTNLQKAQAALAAGADVNEVYEEDTLLGRALRVKSLDIARLILQSPQVNVNKRGTFEDGFGSRWERTPLHQACRLGYTDIVELLLTRGADVNARDRVDGSPLERGRTPVIMAAGGNHLGTLQALFAQGRKPDVHARDRDGLTALWYAVMNNSLEVVQFLHTQGAKINIADKQGTSVLTLTILHKGHDLLDFLVAKGADINMVDQRGMTPLMAALIPTPEKRAIVLSYLEKFLSYKPKLDIQALRTNSGGESALQMASRMGFLEAVRLLLDRGADINLASLDNHRTALFAAAAAGRVDVAKHLIQAGAKSEIPDQAGYTPLLAAVIQTDPDMVRALVGGGVATDVSSPKHTFTPLVTAAGGVDPTRLKKRLEIIKILLDGKADINFPASDGRTALLAAAATKDTALSKATATLLLDRGADPDAANTKGETPLMLAAGAGNEDVVRLLLKKNAQIGRKSGAGETVMSFAARSGNPAITALLKAKGAQPDAPVPLAAVVVKDLLGTWVGQQDGLPQAVFTLTLKKDNTFDFNSKFTTAALAKLPKGAVNPVIATQKGTYTINGDILVLNVAGAAPLSRKWVLEGGVLILDKIIKLKKSR